jgi:hypothetical protein
MKQLLLTLATLGLLTSIHSPASASVSYGGEACGLVDDLSDDALHTLQSRNVETVDDLTPLQKRFVVLTARNYLGDSQDDISIENATDAVSYLQQVSEGGDLSADVLKIHGQIYSLILFYPGGNPVGLIFSGMDPIASVSDGDIGCLD